MGTGARRALVTEMYAYGWSPAELSRQHRHLTLGQVHSALAYYWDHREEIDADRERRFAEAEQLREAAEPSAISARLREEGLLD